MTELSVQVLWQV